MRNFLSKNKTLFVMLAIFAVCVVNASAQNAATNEMDNTVFNIVNFFNGGWVKGVCCVALIGECLGLLAMGGQNPQIFKKFLPFIVGTVLFMCAGKIVSVIWNSNQMDFANDLSS